MRSSWVPPALLLSHTAPASLRKTEGRVTSHTTAQEVNVCTGKHTASFSFLKDKGWGVKLSHKITLGIYASIPLLVPGL